MPRPKKVGAPEPKRRSRNGCWPCKARKVKCDETRPTCVNCSKLNEICDYSIRLNWEGRGKKRAQSDIITTGQSNFLTSNQTTPNASDDPSASGSFTSFRSPPAVYAHRDEHSSRDDGASGKRMADTSMIDPALTRPAYPPIVTFQDTLPKDYGRQNQHYPQSFERYQSSAPITPLSAQSPSLSIFGHLQVADESGSPISNRSALPSTESPLSTPPYLGSGHGTPATESSIADRPAKRTRYDSSLHSARMLPPLVLNSDPNYDSRNTTIHTSQVESESIRGVDIDKTKATPSREFSRRLSVNSLLSGPLDGTPSEQPSNGRGWDYQSQDWTPYMHDVYQDTETWGIDRGLVDLDIGKNDDINAISESSPKLLGSHQDFDLDNGGELSPMEFGFGMEINETALEVGYYDKPVSICIPRVLQPLPAKLLENPMNLLMAVRDDDLLHLLLAYSATHRARLLRQPEPATRIALWVKDIFPNLRHALDDPNKITSNVNLATVIMLASLEIISPKVFGVAVPWQKHLEFARQMLFARGGAHRMQTISRKDKVSSFLWSWFAYLDVLGSMSGGQNISSAWMLDYETEDEEDGYQIDCILGFTSHCIRILAKVANLARQCDERRINPDSTIKQDWQPSDEVVTRAHKLEADLVESRRHPAKPCTHMQSKSEAEYGWDSLEVAATNEAFHSAGLVHLHRRILGKPSVHEDVQHAVGEILGSFNKIRKGSSAEACLLFPMFTAGCDIWDEKQRSDILERMNRVERYGMTQAHKARRLMEQVWESGKPWETLVGGEFFG
ncbi:hypothetical protein BCON_0683g00040 [Botryotinia convoluta]|uniref:Zn(2)-C6 fungal-type domain-containing protein n=1 Tax=Botryotinia convoluta TaxID=54673 RepID=A0A4Z1H5E7_9HELO|nr:hypothetical protein BCON_0683g00040 [Botryotinia convoluta]